MKLDASFVAPSASGDRSPRKTSAPFAARDAAAVEWVITEGLTPYEEAVAAMEARAAAIHAGEAGELVWLLEHPPLYTAGVSARPADLIAPDRFSRLRDRRGGQFTYHGPGQRVAYVMLDLTARRQPDARAFVDAPWRPGSSPPCPWAPDPRGRDAMGGSGAADAPAGAARGQDRGDRRETTALGQLSRHQPERHAGQSPILTASFRAAFPSTA